jgi:hypothetical protein
MKVTTATSSIPKRSLFVDHGQASRLTAGLFWGDLFDGLVLPFRQYKAG